MSCHLIYHLVGLVLAKLNTVRKDTPKLVGEPMLQIKIFRTIDVILNSKDEPCISKIRMVRQLYVNQVGRKISRLFPEFLPNSFNVSSIYWSKFYMAPWDLYDVKQKSLTQKNLLPKLTAVLMFVTICK